MHLYEHPPTHIQIAGAERDEARATIKHECVAAKTAALKGSEQASAAVTKDLYWKVPAAP